ncbi:hypothetical protein [Methanoregula sp.]|uniref:hypothetical protein n=1 Tax=Methanoregula sp. TaxID=2052170 RepID=UPI0023719E49|nr:hypothetical protein [Methanoregula sp.]MDD1686068.1 hypothetical protein [Methanoregula sp.]
MSICDYIKEDTAYHRLILDMTYTRNENLASYIRLTDGAIWGFLGLAFYNLFDVKGCSSIILSSLTNLLIFLFLFVISMYLWRRIVMSYQNDIVKGYCRMAHCEYNLGVPYNVSISQHFIDKLDVSPKPQDFPKLFPLLNPEKFEEKTHKCYNIFSCFFSGLALSGIIVILFNQKIISIWYWILLVPVVAIIWVFYWYPIFVRKKNENELPCEEAYDCKKSIKP